MDSQRRCSSLAVMMTQLLAQAVAPALAALAVETLASPVRQVRVEEAQAAARRVALAAPVPAAQRGRPVQVEARAAVVPVGMAVRLMRARTLQTRPTAADPATFGGQGARDFVPGFSSGARPCPVPHRDRKRFGEPSRATDGRGGCRLHTFWKWSRNGR